MADIIDNLAATTDPGTANDSSQGYKIGSEWFNTATGQMWKAINVSVGAAQWVRAGVGPAWPSARYRAPDHLVAISNGQVAADKLTLMPIIIHRRTQIDRIGMRLVTAQAAGEMRLGLYRTDATTELPASLFADAGTVDLSGATGLKTITVNWFLVPGVYWLAAVNKGGGTLPTVQRAGQAIFGRILGTDDGDVGGGNAWRYLEAAFAYAALPANAPAMTPSAGSDGPVLMIRRA